MMVGVTDEHRAARRAFIKSQHPDAGGDPAAFIAGLARFEQPDGAGEPGVRVHRSRRPDRVLRHTVRSLRRRWRGQPPRDLH